MLTHDLQNYLHGEESRTIPVLPVTLMHALLAYCQLVRTMAWYARIRERKQTMHQLFGYATIQAKPMLWILETHLLSFATSVVPPFMLQTPPCWFCPLLPTISIWSGRLSAITRKDCVVSRNDTINCGWSGRRSVHNMPCFRKLQAPVY
jgi:hypothetical protein